MFWLFCIAAVIAICQTVLLVRATKLLIQYDDLWQDILPVLQEYSEDLSRMSSADLDGILVGHPEVLAFHRRNLLAKQQIESLVDSLGKRVPAREKNAPVLPRPDME